MSSLADPWLTFDEQIKVGLDLFIPMGNRRCDKSKPPWFDHNVQRLSNFKREKFKKFIRTKATVNFCLYKESEKMCKKAIRKAKRKFEYKIAHSSNKRQFVAYVKSKNKCRETIGPLMKNGKLYTDSKDMCGILNEFFGSVFTQEKPGELPVLENMSNGHNIFSCSFNIQEIIKEIDNLKPSTSKGPTQFSNKFLKEYKVVLAKPLSILFNHCLTNSYVPNVWKTAYVVPIYKKGSKKEAGNYRPVSLTCIVCKLFERMLKNKIVDHLETNRLINSSQHGFR